MVINHDLQLPFTMDAHQMTNPYQATILRTDLNRAIPSFIPEILEESNLAMDERLLNHGVTVSVNCLVLAGAYFSYLHVESVTLRSLIP